MNRTNICKNIVQSIKDISQIKLNWNPIGGKTFCTAKKTFTFASYYLSVLLFKSFHVPESFTDQRRTGHAFFSGCFKTGTFQSQTVH